MIVAMTSRWRWTIYGITLCLTAIIASPLLGVAEVADVEILDHTDGGLVGGQWKLDVVVLGSVSGVWMTVDDGNGTALDCISAGRYTTVLDTRAHSDGNHSVLVEAYDGSGGNDQVVIGLEVDNTPPEIGVQWPNDGNLIWPFEVNVTFSDAHPNGSRAWVEASGANLSVPLARTSWGFVGTIGITALVNGTDLYTVVAVDGAGNSIRSDARALDVGKLPDLALTEYRFGRSYPQIAPVTKRVSFTVMNKGFAEVHGFDVGLYVNGSLMVKTHFKVNLTVNMSYRGSLEWWVERAGSYNLTLVLDPDDAIQELDETNNEHRDRQAFAAGAGCLSTIPIIMIPVISCMLVGCRSSMTYLRNINKGKL